MTGRITTSDLASILASVRTAAISAGIPEAARWQLEAGSKTYGRAYRLWLQRPGETGHYSPMVSDFLGMTAGEAFATLATLRSAFLAVSWARTDATATCGSVSSRGDGTDTPTTGEGRD